MELAIVGVRTAAETDGQLVPVPGTMPNSIVYEPQDGSQIKHAIATALRVDVERNHKRERALQVSEVRATIFVTDSRIAFAVGNFDKGGGWVGTSSLVLAFNALSRARASYRSRGLTLAGQVRYAWLEAIGGSQQYGVLDSERLLIVTRATVDGAKTRVYLEFTLPKDVSSTAVAAETARRAARFRLAAGEGSYDPEALAPLDALADSGTLVSEKGKFALHTFPGCWTASTASVDLAALIARQEQTSTGTAVTPIPGLAQPVLEPAQPPPVPDQPSAARTRPAGSWTARLDDGQEIGLTGLTLFGRAPAANPEDVRLHGPDGVTLIPLVDDTMTLSKTHLAVAVDDEGPLVTDRQSTNGSTVSAPDQAVRLVPSVAHRLHGGDVVGLGGRSFAIVAPAEHLHLDEDFAATIHRSSLPQSQQWIVQLDDGQRIELPALTGFGRDPSAKAEEYRRFGYANVKLVALSGDEAAPETHVFITCGADGPVLDNRSSNVVSIKGGRGWQSIYPGHRTALGAGDTVSLAGRTLTLACDGPKASGSAAPVADDRPEAPLRGAADQSDDLEPVADGFTVDAVQQHRTADAPPPSGGGSRRPVLIAVGVVAALLFVGNFFWSNRATTLEQVCADYTDVWIAANSPYSGVYGNPVFNAVEDLAHSAAHYGGDFYDFSYDADALGAIADSSTTSEYEIANASQVIAGACARGGHD